MTSCVDRRVSELKQSISSKKHTKEPYLRLAVKASLDSTKLGKSRNLPQEASIVMKEEIHVYTDGSSSHRS